MANWTVAHATVQFTISDFDFEMQDSSNFKFSYRSARQLG